MVGWLNAAVLELTSEGDIEEDHGVVWMPLWHRAGHDGGGCVVCESTKSGRSVTTLRRALAQAFAGSILRELRYRRTSKRGWRKGAGSVDLEAFRRHYRESAGARGRQRRARENQLRIKKPGPMRPAPSQHASPSVSQVDGSQASGRAA